MGHSVRRVDGGEGRNLALDDWQPISSAPRDRDLQLSVIEDGEVYALVFPCRRKSGQWAHAKTGKLVEVDPTHWRDWTD